VTQPGACPFPHGVPCTKSPTGPSYSSISCNTASIPSGYVTIKVYQTSSSCSGNVTALSAYKDSTCVSQGPQSEMFDCSAKTVTHCTGSSASSCSGAGCNTTAFVEGKCVTAAGSSTLISC